MNGNQPKSSKTHAVMAFLQRKTRHGLEYGIEKKNVSLKRDMITNSFKLSIYHDTLFSYLKKLKSAKL